MFCEKCGNEMPEGSKFCEACGAKIEHGTIKTIFCRECGKEIPETSDTCPECGFVRNPFAQTPEVEPDNGAVSTGKLNPVVKIRQIASLIICALIIILSFMPLFTVTTDEIRITVQQYGILDIEPIMHKVSEINYLNERDRQIDEHMAKYNCDYDRAYTVVTNRFEERVSGESVDKLYVQIIQVAYFIILIFCFFEFVYCIYKFSKPLEIANKEVKISSIKFPSVSLIFLCICIIITFYILSPMTHYNTTISLSVCSILIFALTITNIIINIVTRNIDVFEKEK